MSRSDTLLYSGLTSSSFAAERKKRVERKEKTERKKAEAKPFAEDILTVVSTEREAIGKELANVIHAEMDAQDIKATVLGLKQADLRIKRVESAIKNILKVK
jgi:hypothetical protein